MFSKGAACLAAAISLALCAPRVRAADEWTMIPLAYKSKSPISAHTVIKLRCSGDLPKLVVRIATDERGTALKDSSGNDIEFTLVGKGQIETIVVPTLTKQLYLVVGKTITRLDSQPRFDMAFSMGSIKHMDFQTVSFKYLNNEFTLDLTTITPGFPKS
ncbi:MAG TPA: hypothetical protein EYN91_07105 [Candidatus Melainabacteria bacterium]|nr:hypothetical protein [Candidatus Melainabacteria bacterium]HIN66100.1 hypothetical protein [Candidatus Obscuribacterales bacterium]